jgi:very-short-patch-repair endonuclease
MGFSGVPDRQPTLVGIEADGVAPPINTTDGTLATAYQSSHLQDRLLRTWSDARTVLEEQGVNTLFLAVGMLQWVEHHDSERRLRAPLVLVPAVLERGDRGRFKLKWSGEDVGGNLSLAVKMKEEFEIEWPDVADAEDIEVAVYLAAVERAVSGKPGFQVEPNALFVDLFSYAKYLMFKDLDSGRWPTGQKPHEHGVVGGLLGGGIGRDEPPSPDQTPLDDHRPPESAFEVCDADSSQTLVLIDASSGKNMVVEGPPGTGKSQTIANILAESVARGKTVLFVAEKMAALEVVKRRLDECRIGDACLELHSHKTRKGDFLKDLGRTLGLDRLQLQGATEHAARLKEARDKLNEYVRDLHRPIDPTGWTPFEAQAELARISLATDPPPRGRESELASLARDGFEASRRAVRDMQDKIREIGTPRAHPFFGCRPQEFLPGDVPALSAELSDALAATSRVRDSGGALARQLGTDPPSTPGEASGLALAAEELVAAPELVQRCSAAEATWWARREEILSVLSQGIRCEELHDQFDVVVVDDAWGQDVEPLLSDLQISGPRWTRLLKPAFYRSRRRLRAVCRGLIPSTFADRQRLAEAIREEDACARTIRASDELMRVASADAWRGLRTEFRALRRAAEWIVRFHESVATKQIPERVLGVLVNKPITVDLPALASGLRTDIRQFQSALAALAGRLVPTQEIWGPGDPTEPTALDRVEFEKFEGWLHAALSEPRRVLELVAYNRLRDVAAAQGLESFCQIADAWEGASGRLEDALLSSWCERVVRIATKDRPALARFERVSHENLVHEYRRLDRQMLEVNRERVRTRHRASLPIAVGAGATGLLREQINLTRRQKAIRRLMLECAEPIQRLKPIFLMSPFSVAMFLPPDGPKFDLVVFDEASQVRPEEAIGAILRANQAIVVGDSHQLPPTSFFENTLSDEDREDDDDQSMPAHVAAGDMESILSLMRARGADARDLQWHYRSRHASLIRVSRQAFYPMMDIFPSPDETTSNVGLRLNHLPGSVYGRGDSRTNVEEAEAVVAAIREHARTSPNLTLGVVAFSVSQQMAILRRLERLQRAEPTVEAFAAAFPNEPLFVKNLENVQGDERDVILISIGYGRDASGSLTRQFGPLNNDGGERRLNVLISRARQRCEVFSNFTGDDLGLPPNAPKGVRLLKTYLKFAESGELDVAAESGRPPGSPFEVSVATYLRGEGHTVQHQVGSAGYFIDLAVVDPTRSGRYLLAIECDGATYHSARCARDRDRLREQVLRAKGWQIHRIWSTSWYRETESEKRKLLAAIHSARPVDDPSATTPARAESSAATAHPDVRVLVSKPPTAATKLTVPYAMARISLNLRGKELHEIWIGSLAEAISAVVAVECPVHFEEVIRRIRMAAGVQRAGNRIRDAFDSAKRHAERTKTIQVRGAFLWTPGMTVPPVRDRSGLPVTARSLDYVAPEEVQRLMLGVAANAFRIHPEELADEAARLFGFERITAEMRSRLEHEVRALIEAGQLVNEGDLVRVAASADEGR